MGEGQWADADALALAVLARHDGVARMKAFAEAGLTPYQVAALYRRGVLDRPQNARYSDPALPWQAKRAIRVGGVLCCVSAVDSFGEPVPPGTVECTHVLMPGNAPRARHSRNKRQYVVPGEDREVQRHWSHADSDQAGWHTGLVESLVRCADCVPEDWWIAALDAARHVPRDAEPLLSDAEWSRFLALLPDRLRRAIDLVDARSEELPRIRAALSEA